MLGGLSVAIGDCVAASSREAALAALDSRPDVSVVHLSRALGRSHSATVRLVDGLARAGLVKRAAGQDRDSRWRTCRLCEERRCETAAQPCPVNAAGPR
jgi:MarR family